jgi:hypothetical protein
MIHLQLTPEVNSLFESYAKVAEANYLADKLIEEMAELTQAIIKYRLRKDSNRFADLELEFADVLVHLSLLQEKFVLIPSCQNRIRRIERHFLEKTNGSA